MFIVKIDNKVNLERALKILKNKVVKTGMIKNLRSRQEFVKKSEVRREEVRKAIYIQKLKEEQSDNS